jgi:hypothetical protein
VQTHSNNLVSCPILDGYEFLYDSKNIDLSRPLGPLPPALAPLLCRVKEQGRMPCVPDQVTVQEYLPGGIHGLHNSIDSHSFARCTQMVCCAVLCCAVLCCAVLCCAVLYCRPRHQPSCGYPLRVHGWYRQPEPGLLMRHALQTPTQHTGHPVRGDTATAQARWCRSCTVYRLQPALLLCLLQ